jgi:hypothetical protein
MAHDHLRDSALMRAVTDLVQDLADLVHKELRLARAEIAHKLTLGVHAGIRMAVAAVLAIVGVLLVIEGVVFALAATGLPLHWSCFVVAAILLVAAAIAFYSGRAAGTEDWTPVRTVRQFNETIRTAKEHLQ